MSKKAQSKEEAEIPKIFDQDEMGLLPVDPNKSTDELLNLQGVFYLKDVARHLDINSQDLKRKAKELEVKGESPWEVMGIRKTWSHWIVRMSKFSPYFRKFMLPKLATVQDEWDTNEMLNQKGVFYLSDVCTKLPFTVHNIKYQVRRNPKSRDLYGVWKDPDYKTYLVDMEVFANWIRRVWASK
ncbi:MAG: hypothetical protein H6510_12415 [Acidobacteria bacterium]|nr:hypothetical protein [Acidobacteriota bacterium]MCB9398609.1 hypothetical protein [Acidobacteriota bacterium]